MDLTQLYGPGYAGYLHGRESAQGSQLQTVQGLGMLSTMQRQAEQAKLLEQELTLKRLAEQRERQKLAIGLGLLSGTGINGTAPTQALTQGAAEGDIGPTNTNAQRLGMLNQAQGGMLEGMTAEQILGLGIAGVAKPEDVLKLRAESRPTYSIRDGVIMGGRPGDVPRFAGFAPQVRTSQSGQTIVASPDANGQLSVAVPPGALDAYSAFRNADESTRASHDLVTVPPTSPGQPPMYKTRAQLVAEAQGQGVPGGQLQITSPDEPTAERAALDLYNRGVRNFRVDAGAPPSTPASRPGGVPAGMSPAETAGLKGLEREKETEAKYLVDGVWKPSQAGDKQAARDIPRLQFLLRMDLDTGKMAPAKELLYGYAKELGLGSEAANQWLADAQQFKAFMSDRVLQKQIEQSGPQTESDARRIEQTSAALTSTPEANKFLLSVELAQAKRSREYAKFLRDYRFRTNSLVGVEAAWAQSPAGQRSLFDDSVLKQWAERPKPSSQGSAAGSSEQLTPAERRELEVLRGRYKQ